MPRSLSAFLTLAAVALSVPAAAQAPIQRPARAAPAAPVVLQPVPAAALRPLPVSAADLTLRGEMSSQERVVFVTAADALRLTAFQITFLNAVSILPEASRLIVSVNDQPVGEITLNATVEASTSVLRLPPGLVVPGFNSVRLTAVQRHRVDCSVDATYELWTAIDPRNTGFAGAGPAQIRRLAELPALSGADGGITRLRLRVNDGADARTLARSMRVAQALTLLGFAQLPAIEFSSEPGTGPGIDVLVGTAAALADLALPEGAVIEPELGLSHVRETGSERSVLAFVGRTGADLDAMITRLEAQVAQRSAIGSPQGLRALANQFGRRADSGSGFRFADLGFETTTFEGPLNRAGVRVMLPGDFFPAPYGKAHLRLSGNYAAEADMEGRLEIRVNDRVVVGIPLERGSNDLFSGRDIELPLEAFRPGMNTIGFEVSMRQRGQGACDPTVRQPRARLMIGGGSRLELGQLARIGQYPRLAATLSHGLPYAGSGRPLDVYVSASDPAYLDAAATLVARMAASAQTQLPVAFHFGRAALRGGSGGLVVGPLSEAPEFVGLNAVTVVAETAQPAAQPARPVQLASTDAVPLALGMVDRGAAQPVAAAPAATASDPFAAGRLNEIASLREVALQHVEGAADRLRQFGLLPPARRAAGSADTISPNSVVFTQWAALPPGVPQWQALTSQTSRPEVWTALSAPSPAAITDAVERLSSPALWYAVDGTRAIFRAEQQQVQSFEPASYVYAVTTDSSPGNWRLVGAGWLSLNFEIYIAAIAIACIVLGLFTSLTLRVVRR